MVKEIRPEVFRFWGGEFVRLLRDQQDYGLMAGECGVVWGVYDADPPLYEASFCNREGAFVDMMFYEGDVEEVLVDEAPFADKLKKLVRDLDEFEAKLKAESIQADLTLSQQST